MADPQPPLAVLILPAFHRDYGRLPGKTRSKADDVIGTLATRQFHRPGLGFKKMAGRDDVWEARVTQNYRMTIHVTGTHLILRRIGTHDVLRRP